MLLLISVSKSNSNHDSVSEFEYFIIVTKRNLFHIELIYYNVSLT